jgi:chromatin structure-remodeling complex protein RSC7
LSYRPLIASLPDKSYTHHIQSSISGLAAKGLASVEYVFEDRHTAEAAAVEHHRRMQLVREAGEWERDMKARKMAL